MTLDKGLRARTRARLYVCARNRAEVKKRRMKQGAEDGRKSGVRERGRERQAGYQGLV